MTRRPGAGRTKRSKPSRPSDVANNTPPRAIGHRWVAVAKTTTVTVIAIFLANLATGTLPLLGLDLEGDDEPVADLVRRARVALLDRAHAASARDVRFELARVVGSSALAVDRKQRGFVAAQHVEDFE